MKRIILALATVLTFNCSNGGDEEDDNTPMSSSLEISSSSGGSGSSSSSSSLTTGENSSFIFTRTYDIVQSDDNTLHLVRDGAENCQEDGTVRKEKDYTLNLNYLLSGNALSLSWNEGWEEDRPIEFPGTSNQLNGTWTRTKNIDTSCRLMQGIDNSRIRCDEGYDIIKAVFTQTTATFTHDVCLTEEGNTDPPLGWTSRVADCRSVEYSKGTDKITVKVNTYEIDEEGWGYIYTYGNKTCGYNFELSIIEKEQACASAIIQSKESAGEGWRDVLQDFYRHNIYNFDAFIHCLENKGFPREFWGYYYDNLGD